MTIFLISWKQNTSNHPSLILSIFAKHLKIYEGNDLSNNIGLSNSTVARSHTPCWPYTEGTGPQDFPCPPAIWPVHIPPGSHLPATWTKLAMYNFFTLGRAWPPTFPLHMGCMAGACHPAAQASPSPFPTMQKWERQLWGPAATSWTVYILLIYKQILLSKGQLVNFFKIAHIFSSWFSNEWAWWCRDRSYSYIFYFQSK